MESISRRDLEGNYRAGVAIISGLGSEPSNQCVRYKFDLINFTYDFPDQIFAAEREFTACVGNVEFNATLRLHPHYWQIEFDLRKGSHYRVTAELELVFSASVSCGDVYSWVDDFCYLLSISTGRRINWISCQTDAANGSTSIRHKDSITKPWTAMCPRIRPNICLQLDPVQFALRHFQNFSERKYDYRLTPGIIDHWLDARLQTDYLEARMVKFAVTLEAINTTLARVCNEKGGCNILSVNSVSALA